MLFASYFQVSFFYKINEDDIKWKIEQHRQQNEEKYQKYLEDNNTEDICTKSKGLLYICLQFLVI